MEIGEILPEELSERLKRGERPDHSRRARARGNCDRVLSGRHAYSDGRDSLRVTELDPDQETVVVCHHGIRSAQVAMYLARLGFERVSNLSGGIDLWSATVDPAVARY